MTKPKILLVHGWGYNSYTSSGNIDAWASRLKLVDALSEYFNVVKFNLPGFGGKIEPNTPWGLEDYTNFVSEIIKREKPDYILGYSFGGAITLNWKSKTSDKNIKIFLVSPAIIRKYSNKNLSNTIFNFLPNSLLLLFRDVYLIYIIRNPYYSLATKVMRETYRNIVSVDLRNELNKLNDPITLIYGSEDTITPVNLIIDTLLTSRVKHSLEVISGGGHDIANSHKDKLLSLIVH